jgi:4-amino-4-deoxy-L-arabinose transferase-like glycosyltransferase
VVGLPGGLRRGRPYVSFAAQIAVPLAAAGVLYAWSIGANPVYLNDAEIRFSLQAHAIATTAHDTNGRLLPLYFQMQPISENVWFHPAVVYWTAAFLTFLPLTEWSVRLPTVCLGLIDILLTYTIARRAFDRRRWALLAAAFLALTPSHFLHSRLTMDYLYPVPCVLAWLLCLLIYLERRRLPWLFAATSCLGGGFYSYIASVIMMPLYVVFTMITLWYTVGRCRRPYVAAAAGFLWPLLLLVWVVFHPQVVGQTLNRYQLGQSLQANGAAHRPLAEVLEEVRRPSNFMDATRRLSLYWYFFDPSYLFVTGGYANPINSTRHVGVFPLPFLLFVPLGIVALARRGRRPIAPLILAGFASAPVAACLAVPEPYAIDRELALLPFGVLIATAGVRELLMSDRRTWRRMAIAGLAIVPLHFTFFLFEYYTDYRWRAAFWFEWNHRDAFELVLARHAMSPAPAIYITTDRVPYMEEYWRFYTIKHHRQDLLQRTIYFTSASLNPQSIQAGSLLVVGPHDAAAEALVQAGQLRRVAAIPEPRDPPFFAVLER